MLVRVLERWQVGDREHCRLQTPFGELDLACEGATSPHPDPRGLEWTFDVPLRIGHNARVLDPPVPAGITRTADSLVICASVEALEPDGVAIVRIGRHGLFMIDATQGGLRAGDAIELVVPLERTLASLHTL